MLWSGVAAHHPPRELGASRPRPPEVTDCDSYVEEVVRLIHEPEVGGIVRQPCPVIAKPKLRFCSQG